MGVGVLFPLGIPIAEDKGRSFCSPGRADPEVMGGAETVSGSEWSRTTGDSIPAVGKSWHYKQAELRPGMCLEAEQYNIKITALGLANCLNA